MTELELVLKLSVQQQLMLRLYHATKRYGAHTPACRLPCTCGWAKEAEALELEVRAKTLKVLS